MADEQIILSIEGVKKLLRKLEATRKSAVIERSLFQGGLHIAAWSKERRLSGPRPRFLGVVTGRLRSSISVSRTEHSGDQYITRIGTNVKYAQIHELGLKGNVSIKSFVRKTGRGTALVRSHTRKVNMPKRPFLKPSIMDRGNQEQVLNILTENINEAMQKS